MEEYYHVAQGILKELGIRWKNK